MPDNLKPMIWAYNIYIVLYSCGMVFERGPTMLGNTFDAMAIKMENQSCLNIFRFRQF